MRFLPWTVGVVIVCVFLQCAPANDATTKPTTQPKPTPAKPTPDEKLVTSSVFKGSQNGDSRVASSKRVAATFKITSRQGNDFFGEYWLRPGGGKRGLNVHGRVTDAKTGAVAMEPSALIVGDWDGDVLSEAWYGKISGDNFSFERTIGKRRRVTTVELSFDSTDAK